MGRAGVKQRGTGGTAIRLIESNRFVQYKKFENKSPPCTSQSFERITYPHHTKMYFLTSKYSEFWVYRF